MAFKKKTWVNRSVEFPGRRRLTDVATGEQKVYDVARNEGTVSKEGDAFSATNMNDLEQRIADEFSQINSNLSNLKLITRLNVGTNDKAITIPDNAKFIVINAVVIKGQTVFTRMFPTSIFSTSDHVAADNLSLFYSPTTYCTNMFSIHLTSGKYLLKYLQWSASSGYASDGYVDVFYM